MIARLVAGVLKDLFETIVSLVFHRRLDDGSPKQKEEKTDAIIFSISVPSIRRWCWRSSELTRCSTAVSISTHHHHHSKDVDSTVLRGSTPSCRHVKSIRIEKKIFDSRTIDSRSLDIGLQLPSQNIRWAVRGMLVICLRQTCTASMMLHRLVSFLYGDECRESTGGTAKKICQPEDYQFSPSPCRKITKERRNEK